MIETAEALEQLDEIMSTPGVDGAYIGPSDLAYALGLTPTGDNNDPKHVETVQRIFDAARRHGVAPGIHTSSVEYTTRYLKMGFQMVTLGGDRGFMGARAGASSPPRATARVCSRSSLNAVEPWTLSSWRRGVSNRRDVATPSAPLGGRLLGERRT